MVSTNGRALKFLRDPCATGLYRRRGEGLARRPRTPDRPRPPTEPMTGPPRMRQPTGGGAERYGESRRGRTACALQSVSLRRRGISDGVLLTVGGMLLMAVAGVGTYMWARSDRMTTSHNDTRLDEPAVRVLTWRDWYLELHPSGFAHWYRTSCRNEVGHGRWVPWKDGAVTLSPMQTTNDLNSWQQLAAPGFSHLELRPDGAGYFTEGTGALGLRHPTCRLRIRGDLLPPALHARRAGRAFVLPIREGARSELVDERGQSPRLETITAASRDLRMATP